MRALMLARILLLLISKSAAANYGGDNDESIIAG
jgi:hypothetical protein